MPSLNCRPSLSLSLLLLVVAVAVNTGAAHEEQGDGPIYRPYPGTLEGDYSVEGKVVTGSGRPYDNSLQGPRPGPGLQQQGPGGQLQNFHAALTLLAQAIESLAARVGILEDRVNGIREALIDSNQVNSIKGARPVPGPARPVSTLSRPAPTPAGGGGGGGGGSCRSQFERVGSNCYYLSVRSYKRANWQVAQKACASMGAKLADPADDKTLSLLAQHLSASSNTASYSYWLGALHPGVAWHWLYSGQKVSLQKALWTYSTSNSFPGGRQRSLQDAVIIDFNKLANDTSLLARLIRNITDSVDRRLTDVAPLEEDSSVFPESDSSSTSQAGASTTDSLAPTTAASVNTNNKINLPFNTSTNNNNDRSNNNKSSSSSSSSSTGAQQQWLQGTKYRTSLPQHILLARDGSEAGVDSPLLSVLRPGIQRGDSQLSSRQYRPVQDDPWDIRHGRCLSFQSTVVRRTRTFKYAADQCGYDQYYICQLLD